MHFGMFWSTFSHTHLNPHECLKKNLEMCLKNTFKESHLQNNTSWDVFKVRLNISRTNADSQWNPVYNAFHRNFVVETKRFVGNTVHVILTQQTCGQRSSRAAESKRRALGNYFFKRICYMFLMSKCRGDWDLGLCTTSGLAFGEPKCSGDFRGKNVFRHRKNRILSLRCGSKKT